MKNYEEQLPAGYREVFSVDAKDKKFGILMNVVGIIVMAAVMAVVLLTADYTELTLDKGTLVVLAVFVVGMFAYIVLHELTHGAVYKAMTGHKLTFGITWSAAFCGVPELYVYRRTALCALLAPFLLFTVILLPVVILCGFCFPLGYILSGLLFGMHLGGCSGDLYDTFLLLVKWRDRRLLMNDTGPKQTFYLPAEEK